MRKRIRRGGISPFKAGAIAIIAIVIFVYLGFTKFANPFASQYTVHAVFSNASGVKPGSPVRIAGIDVGQVTGVGPVPGCKLGGTPQKTSGAPSQQCSAADVTFTVSDNGLPIHKDATFAIRPRIFLEGNFFVDLHPGTPEAPTAPSGYTFPIQQGTEPVQFDQVLTSLQSGTRQNLQVLLQQFGTALKKGGKSYNASIQYWLPAYKYSAVVAHDALGIDPHDLSNAINDQGTVSGAIDTHPQTLQNLITNFNGTAAAFARENVSLSNAVAELPKTLAAAIPAFHALNAAFCSGAEVPNCAPGPLPQLAKALIPGVKSAGPAIDASLPFITQLRLLMQPSELRGLANDLKPTIPALAKLANDTIPLMKNEVRPAASCIVNVVIPWSHLTINDPNFNASNGFPPREAYIEAVDFLPGLAGESRNFDANGPYIRVLGNGGTLEYSLSPGLFGESLAKLVGVEPAVPPGGQRPPYKPNVACETQAPITTLNDTSAGPTPKVGGANLDAPGAALRAQTALGALADQLRTTNQQQGLHVKVSALLPSLSQLKKTSPIKGALGDLGQ
jgi:phospholipid/cholesterol/gamma-HCH transport system substrate-binding protein